MEHRYINFGQIHHLRDVEVIDISNDEEDGERHSAGICATTQPSPPQELCGVAGMEIVDDLEENEQKTPTSHSPPTPTSIISVSSSIPSDTRDPSSTEALCFMPQASGTSLIGAPSCIVSCVAQQGSTERLFASPSCEVQQACRFVNIDRTRSTLSMDHGHKAGIDVGVGKPMTAEAGAVTKKEAEVSKPVATIKPMEIVDLVGRSRSSMENQRRKERMRELVRGAPNRSSSTSLVAVNAKVDADADADVAAERLVERPKRGREEDPANMTPGFSHGAKRRNSTEIQISRGHLVSTRAKYRILHHGSIETTGTFACGSSSGSSTGASSTTATTRAKKYSASKLVMSKASRARATRIPRSDTSSASKESSSLHVGNATVRVRPDHKQNANLRKHLSVVIDGSNVAFGFTQVIFNPKWCPEGILEAIKFFEARGVEVVAFVPRFRVNGIPPRHEYYNMFMEAMDRGVIAMVPPKTDDDLFILSYAISRGASVVTNDQFNDHQRTPSTLVSLGLGRREFEEFLSDKLVSYTFALREFLPNPTSAIIKELTQRARVNNEPRENFKKK